jgi:hypothetical protein
MRSLYTRGHNDQGTLPRICGGIRAWVLVGGLVSACWTVGCGRTTEQKATPTQSRPQTAYDRSVDGARKAGLAVLPEDIKTGPVPSEQNAAPVYRQIDAHLKQQPTGKTSDEVRKLLAPMPPSPAELARGRKRIAERAELLRLVHEAAARPSCDFQRDWSLGPYVLLSEYSGMRASARWLVGESGLLLRSGKPVDAVNNMALGFRIARHAATDPILIAHLVAVAIDAITLRAMENILYAAGEQPGVAEAVRAAVEREWAKPSLAKGMHGEAVMQYVSIKLLRKSGMKELKRMEQMSEGGSAVAEPEKGGEITPADRKAADAMLDENGAAMIPLTLRIFVAADRPYRDAMKAANAVSAQVSDSKDSKYALARILFPVFEQTPAKRAQDEARTSVVRSSAALLAHRVKNGRFPDRLESAISPVPTDPFDLKPFRYRREGNGFVVWSVGESMKFDGGDPHTKPEKNAVLFRYPLPSYLRDTKPAK